MLKNLNPLKKFIFKIPVCILNIFTLPIYKLIFFNRAETSQNKLIKRKIPINKI